VHENSKEDSKRSASANASESGNESESESVIEKEKERRNLAAHLLQLIIMRRLPLNLSVVDKRRNK
jgi:hypothetical protein